MVSEDEAKMWSASGELREIETRSPTAVESLNLD